MTETPEQRYFMATRQATTHHDRKVARPTVEQMVRAYRKSLEERRDLPPRRVKRAVQRYREALSG